MSSVFNCGDAYAFALNLVADGVILLRKENDKYEVAFVNDAIPCIFNTTKEALFSSFESFSIYNELWESLELCKSHTKVPNAKLLLIIQQAEKTFWVEAISKSIKGKFSTFDANHIIAVFSSVSSG